MEIEEGWSECGVKKGKSRKFRKILSPGELGGSRMRRTRTPSTTAGNATQSHARPTPVSHTPQPATRATRTPAWTAATRARGAPRPRKSAPPSPSPPALRPCTGTANPPCRSKASRRTAGQSPTPHHAPAAARGSTFGRACSADPKPAQTVQYSNRTQPETGEPYWADSESEPGRTRPKPPIAAG